MRENNKKYFALFILSLLVIGSITVSFLAFLYVIVPMEDVIDDRVQTELYKLKYDCKYEIQNYLLTNQEGKE